MIRLFFIVTMLMGGFAPKDHEDGPESRWIINQCELFRPLVEEVNEGMGYGLDENLVLAVMAHESMCIPWAISGDKYKSAGLMQVTPRDWVGTTEQLLNPTFNVHAGQWFLNSALEQTGGNVRLALKGYNCGFGARPACGDGYAYDIIHFWLPRFRISYILLNWDEIYLGRYIME